MQREWLTLPTTSHVSCRLSQVFAVAPFPKLMASPCHHSALDKTEASEPTKFGWLGLLPVRNHNYQIFFWNGFWNFLDSQNLSFGMVVGGGQFCLGCNNDIILIYFSLIFLHLFQTIALSFYLFIQYFFVCLSVCLSVGLFCLLLFLSS